MTVVKRREGYQTPCAHDAMAQSGKPHGWQKNGKELQRNLNDLVVRMAYPTPTAKDANGPWHTTHSPSPNVVISKWPTVTAKDAKNNASKSQFNRHSAPLNVAVVTYPTPRALSLCGGSGAYRQIKNNPNLSDDEKRALIASAGRGVKYDTPTVHGDGGSGRNGAMPKFGQLNPDWVEWLMFWLIGWTDLKKNNDELYWLNPSIDPASPDGQALLGLSIPRVTNRRDNRPARIKELGNGQFPLSAVAAFFWGLCVLEVVV